MDKFILSIDEKPWNTTWLDKSQINYLNFHGANIHQTSKISTHAILANPEKLAVGAFSRIDAFSFLSGNISLGRYCHIAPHCVLSGTRGINFGHHSALSAFCYLFTTDADYTFGETLNLPTVPREHKSKITEGPISLGNFIVVGSHSAIFPNTIVDHGAMFARGCTIKGELKGWKQYRSEGNKNAKSYMMRPRGVITARAQLLDEQNGKFY